MDKMILFQLLIVISLVPFICSSSSYGAADTNFVYRSTATETNNAADVVKRKRNTNRRWRVQNNSISNVAKEPHPATDGTKTTNHPAVQHATQFIAQCNMPTAGGKFYKMRSYRYSSARQNLEPIVMIAGDVRGKEDVLVRVHDQCFTSEVFGSLRCDCKEQLEQALEMISKAAETKGSGGIVIYLQQEGRGIGLANKIAAYSLQDEGLDTVEANTHLGFEEELREYLSVPDILRDLDIKSIRLITNNPFKIDQLKSLGVSINDRVPLQIQANQYNEGYLRSKKDKMKHWLKDELLERPMESAVSRAARRHSGDSSNKQQKKESVSVEVNIPEDNVTNSSSSGAELIDKVQSTAVHVMFSEPRAEQGRVNSQSRTGQWEQSRSKETTDKSVTSGQQLSTGKSSNIPPKSMLVAGGSTQLAGRVSSVENKSHELFERKVAAAVQACGGYIFGKASVEAAIADTKAGKPVIVVDDADRENEGDLILAAEMATAESIGYIVRYTSGVLCISLEGDRLDALNLPPMVVNNEDPKGTAYSVSVDHVDTSTGISAADRALTFRKLVDPNATSKDFQRPGHVFPLRYQKGGVRSRAGHTEASLDLARLAGLQPGGVLAEVVHDDGSMQRLPDLERMAKEHNLVLTSVQDIIAYRVESEFQ